MKPINLNNIEEKGVGGDFKRIAPGAYPCVIMKVEDVEDREYLRVYFDIVAGEFKDYFSDPFYADKGYAHSTVFSYAEKNLPYFKHNLHVIGDCNPGFDAEAAINAGKEQLLVGKAVGVVFREEEYVDGKTGEVKMGSPRPDRVVRLGELEEDRNANPKPKLLTDAQADEQRRRKGVGKPVDTPDGTAAAYAGDIPFDM